MTTPTYPPQLTGDQVTLLSTLATGGFLDDFARIDCQYAAGASRAREIDVSVLPLVTGLDAAAAPYGGYQPNAAAWAYPLGNGGIVVNPSANPWAISMEAILAPPATGKTTYLGLREISSTGTITFGQGYDFTVGDGFDVANGSPHTQLYMAIGNAGYKGATCTFAPDSALHRITIASDTVTMRCLVDGVVVGQITDLTKIKTTNYGVALYGPNTIVSKISRVAIATR